MKFIHRCWCLLLGAFLPNACSENPYDPPAPEYGAPYATVIVDGVVVDNLGAPIRNIRVEMNGFGATTSDTLGNWSIDTEGFASCVADTQIACGLEATEVDGLENGGPYQPTMVVLELEQTSPGSGFNLGTFEQHEITIVMEDMALEYGPQCAAAERARKNGGKS